MCLYDDCKELYGIDNTSKWCDDCFYEYIKEPMKRTVWNEVLEVYHPDTGEFCQTLDMNDNQCYGIRGYQPINEACGGCVGCLLAQAIHYGYNVLVVEDGFEEEHF